MLQRARLSASVRVGGMIPLTTIDYPGKLSAVVFLQGCPWRCGYCQNPGLQSADAPTKMTWDDVLGFLERRRGLLDAVVFSGGEPTLQSGLDEAVAAVRDLGFQVGLHTAGMYPERLAALLPRLDWVGLDVKAPWERHDEVTGVPGSAARVRESLAQLVASGVAHECRTTWHAGLYPLESLQALALGLVQQGVTHWALQRCRVEGSMQEASPVVMATLAPAIARFAGFTVR